VIFAAIFLGETVACVRLSAVAIGLIGDVIVLDPRQPWRVISVSQTGDVWARIMVVAASIMRALVSRSTCAVLVQPTARRPIVFYFSSPRPAFVLYPARRVDQTGPALVGLIRVAGLGVVDYPVGMIGGCRRS